MYHVYNKTLQWKTSYIKNQEFLSLLIITACLFFTKWLFLAKNRYSYSKYHYQYLMQKCLKSEISDSSAQLWNNFMTKFSRLCLINKSKAFCEHLYKKFLRWQWLWGWSYTKKFLVNIFIVYICRYLLFIFYIYIYITFYVNILRLAIF